MNPVLVDTSVWVSHLRKGEAHLQDLLQEGQVMCHPFVIGELACSHLKNRQEILSLLQALPKAPELPQEEVLVFVLHHQLMGKGLGWVDIHLLASARLAGSPLWSRDKALAASCGRLHLRYSLL